MASFFLPSYGPGNSVRLAGRCFFFQEDKISKGGLLLEAEKYPGPTEEAAKDQSLPCPLHGISLYLPLHVSCSAGLSGHHLGEGF